MPVEAPSPVAAAATGGQYVRHWPVHVELFFESEANSYTVRPCASTRIVPSGPLAVLSSDPAGAAVETTAGCGTETGEAVVEPQAAATRAIPASPIGVRSRPLAT
jgi:hypothetical protein